MPTKEPRLNIVLDKQTREALAALAAHRSMTLSSVAAELISEALELEEDLYFSKLAERREQETKEWIPHDEFWKKAKQKLAKKKSGK